jgi:hypothetical protein
LNGGKIALPLLYPAYSCIKTGKSLRIKSALSLSKKSLIFITLYLAALILPHNPFTSKNCIMQKTYILVIFALASLYSAAQNVGIGTNNPNPYAMLEIKDSARGLLIPRMDSTRRKNIPHIKGMMVFDTTTGSFWMNTGTAWGQVVAQRSPCNIAIGDTFAGGLVFYLDASGCHGLVCEAVNQDYTYWAQGEGVIITAYADGIGAGRLNTFLVKKQFGTSPNASYLSTLYSGGGFSDWYLPTRYELRLMYLNLKLFGIFLLEFHRRKCRTRLDCEFYHRRTCPCRKIGFFLCSPRSGFLNK